MRALGRCVRRAGAVERDHDGSHLHLITVHLRIGANRHLATAAETHDDGALRRQRRRRTRIGDACGRRRRGVITDARFDGDDPLPRRRHTSVER
jgi:hypothetical protein